MAVAPDDDVIVHGDAEWFRHPDNVQRHLDVLRRGRRIAGRMIMNEHDRRRRQFERAPDDFAGIDRRMIDCARSLHLVGDQRGQPQICGR